MGKLIEQQSVIDCLTNTAKYYERKDADEWTKGIHYGLLHGVDNILDNVLPVEAIPKDQYETRLRADMVAMLKDLRLEIEKIFDNRPLPCSHYQRTLFYGEVDDLILDKINALKEASDA